MVSVDSIEGLVDGRLWYHYDVAGDVLYLRLKSDLDTPTVGEEDDDGLIVLRDEATDRPVGVTVIDWWRRFGTGDLPDSLGELQRRIQPWAGKLAA